MPIESKREREKGALALYDSTFRIPLLDPRYLRLARLDSKLAADRRPSPRPRGPSNLPPLPFGFFTDLGPMSRRGARVSPASPSVLEPRLLVPSYALRLLGSEVACGIVVALDARGARRG